MNAKQVVNKLLEYGFPEGEPEQPQRSITLGEIFDALPPGTDQQIMDLLNNEPDTIAQARKLKGILAPHAAALEKIGLIVDYTAYMLVHVGNVLRQQAQQQQRRNRNN